MVRRMKAILVIDVNDDTDFSLAKADVTMQEDSYGLLLGNVGKKWHQNISLKPMPKKKELDRTVKYGGMPTHTMYSIAEGYNACIDEILGDNYEEESDIDF